MPELKFGDIILMKFPFTDGTNSKKRPALVIRNTHDGDLVVCRITGKNYNTKFDIDLKNWSQYGLRIPSVIRVHKMVTLESSMVEQIFGTLKLSDKTKVKKIMQMLAG